MFMFCGECGTQNPDTNQFCKNCGKPLKKDAAAAPSSQSVPAPAATPPPSPGSSVPLSQTTVAEKTPAGAKPPFHKGLLLLGIMSILIGVVSWFVYPYVCGILAIVLGGVVLFKSRNKIGSGAIIITILGILGPVIGLASMFADLYYLNFFV
jgi:hypothetical protein